MKRAYLNPRAAVVMMDTDDILTNSGGGVKEFLGWNEVDGPGDELDVSNY